MGSISKILSEDKFSSFLDGDELAFKYVYNTYYELVVRKVIRLCRDKQVAEEIVQESFVQLFINKDKLKDPRAIFPYLHVVSKRLAISHFRKKVLDIEYQSYLQNHWKEDADDVQRKIDQKELDSLINRAIDELPAQQGIIYKMNKLEEKTYHEIAEETGLSKNTVRNHIANASKFIRLKLDNLLCLIFFLF